MPNGDLDTWLPRMRRFARCLYCNTDQGDSAVANVLKEHIRDGAYVDATETFLHKLFEDLLRQASLLDDQNICRVELPRTLDDGLDFVQTDRMLAVISTFDFIERAIIALYIIEGVDVERTAALLGSDAQKVIESIDKVRAQLTQKFPSHIRANSQHLST